MKRTQILIKKFCQARNWEQFHNPKDLLLGVVEEVGELRNVIKWEQDPNVLRQALRDNHKQVSDDIGDLLWFVALLANQAGVDMEEALADVLAKNELRFQVADTLSRHTNTHLGGKDKQYQP